MNDYADTHEKQFILPIPGDLKVDYQIEDHREVNSLACDLKWMAQRQQTRYPVLPIHTPEEKSLFRQLVRSSNRQCDWKRLAREWNDKADGETIFYKLPEHLDSYMTVAKRADNNRDTLATTLNEQNALHTMALSELRSENAVPTREMTSLTTRPPRPLDDPDSSSTESSDLSSTSESSSDDNAAPTPPRSPQRSRTIVQRSVQVQQTNVVVQRSAQVPRNRVVMPPATQMQQYTTQYNPFLVPQQTRAVTTASTESMPQNLSMPAPPPRKRAFKARTKKTCQTCRNAGRAANIYTACKGHSGKGRCFTEDPKTGDPVDVWINDGQTTGESEADTRETSRRREN